MILSKLDYLEYLRRDRIALGLPEETSFFFRVKQLIWPDKTYQFEKALRKLEYAQNCLRRKTVFGTAVWLAAKCRHRHLSLQLGFQIGPNVFGPGLSIPHFGNIVVNPLVRVGENCRIHTGVNIGASGGSDKVPKIGNNVYIGPGAILFGDISIADNVMVGANSTVTKSFLTPGVVIAGSPAIIIKER